MLWWYESLQNLLNGNLVQDDPVESSSLIIAESTILFKQTNLSINSSGKRNLLKDRRPLYLKHYLQMIDLVITKLCFITTSLIPKWFSNNAQNRINLKGGYVEEGKECEQGFFINQIVQNDRATPALLQASTDKAPNLHSSNLRGSK